METKNCNYCKAELNIWSHGNLDYCDELCYSMAKKLRSKEDYQKKKEEELAYKRVEAILRLAYQKYGSNYCFNASELNALGMDYDIFSIESKIEDLPVKVVGEFAYCLFNNQLIRIWKI